VLAADTYYMSLPLGLLLGLDLILSNIQLDFGIEFHWIWTLLDMDIHLVYIQISLDLLDGKSRTIQFMVAVLWGGGELLVNRAIEAATASRHELRRWRQASLPHALVVAGAVVGAMRGARESDEDAGDEDL
jgi:hypothetical protein